MINLAIFASGNGSNAQKIMEYFQGHENISIDIVISNNPKAGVLERADSFGDRYTEMYLHDYPLSSWSVHPGSTSYAGIGEDALESWFGLSHGVAQKCFLEGITICARVMHISEAVEGFYSIIDDLRVTPGAVLAQDQIEMIEKAKKPGIG